MSHSHVYVVKITEVIGEGLPSRQIMPLKFDEDGADMYSAGLLLLGSDWLLAGETGYALVQPLAVNLWPPLSNGQRLVIWRGNRASAKAEVVRPYDLPFNIAGSAVRSDP